jgi:putative hydrolase of the HAD superfamily
MIELVAQLKVGDGLKIAVVGNKGRELNAYWICKFKLAGFLDSFISSTPYLSNEMRSVAI